MSAIKFTKVADKFPPANVPLLVHGDSGEYFLAKIGKTGAFESLYGKNHYYEGVTHYAVIKE